MYREFGKSKNWKRIIIPSIVLYGFFSLPMSAFFIYIAIVKMGIATIAMSVVVCLFAILIPTKHIKNLYMFSLVEIDENFLVVNQPFQNRCVYRLKNITWKRKLFKGILFIHNGFPALLNAGSLEDEELSQLLELIESVND